MPVADLEHGPTETARNGLDKGSPPRRPKTADHNHHRQSSGRSVTDMAAHEPRPTAVGPHRVRLSRAAGFRLPPNTRSVAAPTRWANPFRPAQRTPAANQAAVDHFRAYLARNPALVEQARKELAGWNLACWCQIGMACHADVWLETVNREDQ